MGDGGWETEDGGGGTGDGGREYEAALAAVAAQKSAAGGQRQSTQELAEAEKSARDAYQSLAKAARDLQG